MSFLHGINLGGWFSQCDYSLDNYKFFIQENDIKIISSWGLDHVRIPIDYNFLLVEENLSFLEDAVNWCNKYNLSIVLDLHKTKGFSFDLHENEAGFFENKDYQDYFLNTWSLLAQKFSHYDNIAFELLNEITDKKYIDSWNKIATDCILEIRKISKTVPIIVGSYWYNDIEALKDLNIPIDKNIIYCFHFYEPKIFTHQGATWMMDKNIRIRLNSTYSKYNEYTSKYIGEEGKKFDNFDLNQKISLQYFGDLIVKAVKVANEKNVQLYCSEYGLIDNISKKDAEQWFDYVNIVFSKYHIGKAVWSYRGKFFSIENRPYLIKYL